MFEKQNNKLIGSRIKNIRLEKGMTLEEFGKLFNASKSSVYGWEKGRNLPNKERLKQIAKIGDMKLGVLLKGDKAYSPFIFPDFRNVKSEEDIKNYALECVDIIRFSTPDMRVEELYMMFFLSISVLIEKLLRDKSLGLDLNITEIPMGEFDSLLNRDEWIALDWFISNFFEIENFDSIYFDFKLSDFNLLRKILLKYVEISKMK
ncbi:helix-turn-helix domain-containing protein [Streptococcus uberis]|uniref:helix-turn-helix domain-containing protein n=1 Tax=Streptococcus uberis TaxID=1349 RepID=UPI001C97E106|nr:helix-turn-helix transcriptional regulator [Streptococcus uberis]MBY4765321.1 helix-turn-helix domain-containing protein [Streptococcus uberis]